MNFFRKGRGRGLEVRQHAAPALRQPKISDPREGYVFRRSRTLTGSAANEVKATVPHRADLQSERLKLHQLQQRRRILLSVVFVSVCIALCVWYLLASTITGAKLVADKAALSNADQKKITQTIQEYVNNYPTEVFVSTLNMQRFTTYMQRVYPEIASIELKSSWLGIERSFHISYRQALATWQIGGNKFYIDAMGVAFTTLHGSEPSLNVEDTSGFQPGTDNSVASKRFIRYLGQLLAAAQVKQIGTIERIVIPAAARELNMYIKGRSYPIKTHIDREPYKQVDDIASALAFIDEKHINPQYIDVRVEGRAFYK